MNTCDKLFHEYLQYELLIARTYYRVGTVVTSNNIMSACVTHSAMIAEVANVLDISLTEARATVAKDLAELRTPESVAAIKEVIAQYYS